MKTNELIENVPGSDTVRELWSGIGRGALAGLAATVPMTGVMLALGKLAQRQGQDPFPPREITAKVTRRPGVWQRADDSQRGMLTIAGHLGYGALTGALYGARIAESPEPSPLSGATYGLMVWALSYAGWLPALNILPSPKRTAPNRTLQLVASHLVWGASLGWLMRRLG